PCQLLLVTLKSEQRQQFVDARANGVHRHQMHAADKGQMFACGQVIKQRKVFGQDADHSFRFQRRARIRHIPAQHINLAAGGRKQSGEHFDCRRLARTVGSKEPIKGSAFHLKIHTIDRKEGFGLRTAEKTRQLSCFNGQTHRSSLPNSRRIILTKRSETFRIPGRIRCNKLRSIMKFTTLLMLTLLVSACGQKTEPEATTPAPAEKPADRGGLQDEKMVIPADNPITPEKVALGKQLFFDTRLSKTGKMSCETCH